MTRYIGKTKPPVWHTNNAHTPIDMAVHANDDDSDGSGLILIIAGSIVATIIILAAIVLWRLSA